MEGIEFPYPFSAIRLPHAAARQLERQLRIQAGIFSPQPFGGIFRRGILPYLSLRQSSYL